MPKSCNATSDATDATAASPISLNSNRIVEVINKHIASKFTWEERWLRQRYYVEYILGELAETVSFSVDEIAEGVQMYAESLHWEGDENELVREIVGWSRYCDKVFEYFVRTKNGLPIHDKLPKVMSKHIRQLAKREHTQRTEDCDRLWKLMIFGFCVRMLNRPMLHNKLSFHEFIADEVDVAKLAEQGVLSEEALSRCVRENFQSPLRGLATSFVR